MAVVIRLNKTGTKKKIKHRIVVVDKRSPRDGKFIEIIGHWAPIGKEEELKIDLEKAQEWIKRGAKPTEIVKKLMKRAQAQKAVK